MWSMTTPRRSGKTTFLLERVKEVPYGSVAVLTFNHHAARMLFDQYECDRGRRYPSRMQVIEESGKCVEFFSYGMYMELPAKMRASYTSLFIDELPHILEGIFHNIKGFTGTTQRVKEQTSFSKEDIERLSKQMNVEQYQTEVLGEWNESK